MRTLQPFSWKMLGLKLVVTVAGVSLLFLVLWLAKGCPPLW
jgi:hypothetical protein